MKEEELDERNGKVTQRQKRGKKTGKRRDQAKIKKLKNKRIKPKNRRRKERMAKKT